MSRSIYSFLCFLGLIVMSSCTTTKDLVTKDIFVDLSADFVINQPSNTSWDESKLLDAAAQSPDLATYINVIQKVTLDKVTYKITTFNGPAGQTLTNGWIDIADENGNGRLNLATMTNAAVSGIVGQELEVPMTENAKTYLVDQIKNSPHKAMSYTKGTVSAAPIDMTVRVKFYLTVRVSLL